MGIAVTTPTAAMAPNLISCGWMRVAMPTVIGAAFLPT